MSDEEVIQQSENEQPSVTPADNQNHILRVTSLYKSFGHKKVVRGVELSMKQGEVLGLLGPNGAGKTTTFYMVVGFYKPTAGDVFLDDQCITRLPMYKRARLGIAYLPQEMRLFPELTAWENVQLKNRLTGYKTDSELRGLFERLGIADRMNSLAGKLSIGQQQRVALIRTVCQPCDFFLLDEPVSHLDEVNNGIVAQIISDEALKSGAAVIATSVGNNLNIKVGEVLKL